jgi:hypothetical protein
MDTSETARIVAGSCNKPDGALGGAKSSFFGSMSCRLGFGGAGNLNAWALLEMLRRRV